MTHQTKRYHLLHKPLIVLLALFTLSFSASSFAETTECTVISSLPWVIKTEGIYCLKNNLNTRSNRGNAIEIQANDVTIDFNGYKLEGLGLRIRTMASGVFAAERKNITLRNAYIRGFLHGIILKDDDGNLTNDGGHLIENNHLNGNTWYGILVEGSGNLIRGNQIETTGKSIVSQGAYGIYSNGPKVEIKNNTVHDTFSQGTAYAFGIFMDNANSGIAMQNQIIQTQLAGSGRSVGIWSDPNGTILIQENNIFKGMRATTQARVGIIGSSILRSICINNRIMNFNDGVSGCFDNNGSNVVWPH